MERLVKKSFQETFFFSLQQQNARHGQAFQVGLGVVTLSPQVLFCEEEDSV
jgi:hypothetical protein